MDGIIFTFKYARLKGMQEGLKFAGKLVGAERITKANILALHERIYGYNYKNLFAFFYNFELKSFFVCIIKGLKSHMGRAEGELFERRKSKLRALYHWVVQRKRSNFLSFIFSYVLWDVGWKFF
jgi:hypothetical protein